MPPLKFVKPPTWKELVEAYGSPEAATRYLSKKGVTPDETSRRYGLPYHLVHVYLSGYKIECQEAFLKVASFYDRIASLASAKGRETELTIFLQSKEIEFERKISFILGEVGETVKRVGETTVLRAIALACSIAEEKVRKLFLDYGDVGDVAAKMLPGSSKASLTVDDVYHSLKLIPRLPSLMDRMKVLASLFSCAKPIEGKYIARLSLGELKTGLPHQSMIGCVSRAINIDSESLSKACSLIGFKEGLVYAYYNRGRLSELEIMPMTFIKPMLAHILDPDKLRFPCIAEWKYDGSRLQLHKSEKGITLYSRRGIEKSTTLPEIVDIVKRFDVPSCIVDSEIIAIDKDGKMLPFQRLLDRTVPTEFREEVAKEVQVTIRAFDLLYLNGSSLMNLLLMVRRQMLTKVVTNEYMATGTYCGNEKELDRFHDEAISKGLEGIMVKDPTSLYEVAERSWSWLKLKPRRDTLDCVVVKALYGKGERAGWYSSFRLAVRDPVQKRLYTVGKASNLSQETMAMLRERIDQLKLKEDRDGIWVKPHVVFEVTYQEIVESHEDETSGYALRVPKVVRVRDDKTIEEIDDIDRIKHLFAAQYEERYPEKDLS